MKIEVKWTGEYPSLCFGEWILKIDGEDMSNKIPEELRDCTMNTYGIYEDWHFDKDYNEIWNSYSDGLKCFEWIENNKYWLDTISKDKNTQIKLYEAFQAEDFRTGSCGGCI